MGWGQGTGQQDATPGRRIATEEAFITPEVAEALGRLLVSPMTSLDRAGIAAFYGPGGSRMLDRLLDVEEMRIVDMDAHGVSLQVLSLTSPGVQMFDADEATELASAANDRLAAVIARHPDRYAGLACFAPQSPRRAATEMARAVRQLRLNGFIVNSHTNNEYLDEPRYWPVLEAAEGLDRCLYLHPRAPSDGMAAPFRDYGLEYGMWGYGVETGTHALRLMASGVLDRFPGLTICLGHMGEGVPFWLSRIDCVHRAFQARGRVPRLELTPSEYFRRNFVITTSGVESHPALAYAIEVLGVERVMFAIDYPYQPTGPAVAFMDSAPVSEGDRAKLYHENAQRVFELVPAKAPVAGSRVEATTT